MKPNRLFLIVGIPLAVASSCVAQLTSMPRDLSSSRYVEGELLIKFKGGPRGDPATRAKSAMKHEVKRHFDFIGWQHVRLPTGVTVEEGLARYRNLTDVLAAEPNEVVQMEEPAPLRMGALGSAPKSATASVPNDPLLAEQYGLEKIGARFVWQVTTGSAAIVVAILDG